MTNYNNTIVFHKPAFQGRPKPSASITINALTKRQLSVTKPLLLPNDQDILAEQTSKLDIKHRGYEVDVDEFVEQVHKQEKEVSDDGGATYLSDLMERKDRHKEEKIGALERARDNIFDTEENVREGHSLTAEMVSKSSHLDVKILERVKTHLAPMDPLQDTASELIAKLQTQKEEADSLFEAWHQNDLPPLDGSNEPRTPHGPSFGPLSPDSSPSSSGDFQDSSDVYPDDFTDYSNDVD